MATKLRKMHLTSVDLVRAGANQEADICLFKSADGQNDGQQAAQSEEELFKQFLDWKQEQATAGTSAANVEGVAKEYTTFKEIEQTRNANDRLWRYTDALNASLRSIQEDHDLSENEKSELMLASLDQFDEAMQLLIEDLCKVPEAQKPPDSKPEPAAEKQPAGFDEIEEI